ncbi:hypothetical protein LOD99_15385 [Oopsacas minuta]|uniref:Small RNA 2'-O-methyltransferase n=1 Tax=Oopsacas minuta TaxID=111878 RepID=A0AAV7KD15_9METZ|nr:hypothetical protein LOD99_15385 [Oopsacas minuta]
MATQSDDKNSTCQQAEDPNEVRSKFPELNFPNHRPVTDDIHFNPPLYKQRYSLGIDYVKKFCPSKVVDFGCSECKFMWAIRNQNYEFIREIIGVDIDKVVLETHDCVAKPVTSEYLFKRATPLKIGLYCGSLTQWDPRLEGVEFVSLIEVIEHLEEDTLTQLPTAIFGTLRPKYVFITTPNSEFNILFKNFSGFRHPDHKFEWNREEFMNWCEAICHNFPYQVEYNGAGEPPIGFEDVGYCSQAAFFSLKLEIPNKHLQVNNNNTIDWDNPTTQDDQSDAPIDEPRESIFSHLKLELTNTEETPNIETDMDTNNTSVEANNPNTEPSNINTELTDINMEPNYVYKEIICNEFPLQDPNHTPERQLLLELEYHAMQIAKNEWKKLEEQGVREEDVSQQIYESNGTYFDAGQPKGYLTCYVSIYGRLMSYPQIKFYGTYDDIVNTITTRQDYKLNMELTHYKVELMVEEPGYSDEVDSDECDNDESVNNEIWGDTFQEVVQERNHVSVPESWDD